MPPSNALASLANTHLRVESLGGDTPAPAGGGHNARVRPCAAVTSENRMALFSVVAAAGHVVWFIARFGVRGART